MLAYKGKFKPKNPQKYKGDHRNIIYRSLWELKFFRYLDRTDDIIEWSSEEVSIPYISPIDKKRHRYFPDVILKKHLGNDKYETMVIEIKPKKQTMPPDPKKKNATPTGRVSRRYLNEVKTYSINDAKWTAAKNFCDEKGWKFAIFTENELGIKY